MLTQLISEDTDIIATDIRLDRLNEDIEYFEEQIQLHKRKLKYSQKELLKLKEMRSNLVSQRKELQDKIEYSKLIMELNAYIVGSKYKKDVVEHVANDVLTRIKELDDEFDLDIHMTLFSVF